MNVKGMKGRDFSRVQSWYRLVMLGVQNLVTLIELERNDPQALAMTMNVLKSGLLSEDAEVSILCAWILNKVGITLHLAIITFGFLTLAALLIIALPTNLIFHITFHFTHFEPLLQLSLLKLILVVISVA